MRFSSSSVLLGLVALTTAQLGDLPQCAQKCATDSIPKTCNLDIKCICADASFINSISCCVSTSCQGDDQQKTIQVASQLCKTVGVTLPSTASCEGGSDDTASSAASSAATMASGTAMSASSMAASLASDATNSATGSASSAGAETATAVTTAASSSSSAAAGQNMGSKIGAVGAAIAAIALL